MSDYNIHNEAFITLHVLKLAGGDDRDLMNRYRFVYDMLTPVGGVLVHHPADLFEDTSISPHTPLGTPPPTEDADDYYSQASTIIWGFPPLNDNPQHHHHDNVSDHSSNDILMFADNDINGERDCYDNVSFVDSEHTGSSCHDNEADGCGDAGVHESSDDKVVCPGLFAHITSLLDANMVEDTPVAPAPVSRLQADAGAVGVPSTAASRLQAAVEGDSDGDSEPGTR